MNKIQEDNVITLPEADGHSVMQATDHSLKHDGFLRLSNAVRSIILALSLTSVVAPTVLAVSAGPALAQRSDIATGLKERIDEIKRDREAVYQKLSPLVRRIDQQLTELEQETALLSLSRVESDRVEAYKKIIPLLETALELIATIDTEGKTASQATITALEDTISSVERGSGNASEKALLAQESEAVLQHYKGIEATLIQVIEAAVSLGEYTAKSLKLDTERKNTVLETDVAKRLEKDIGALNPKSDKERAVASLKRSKIEDQQNKQLFDELIAVLEEAYLGMTQISDLRRTQLSRETQIREGSCTANARSLAYCKLRFSAKMGRVFRKSEWRELLRYKLAVDESTPTGTPQDDWRLLFKELVENAGEYPVNNPASISLMGRPLVLYNYIRRAIEYHDKHVTGSSYDRPKTGADFLESLVPSDPETLSISIKQEAIESKVFGSASTELIEVFRDAPWYRLVEYKDAVDKGNSNPQWKEAYVNLFDDWKHGSTMGKLETEGARPTNNPLMIYDMVVTAIKLNGGSVRVYAMTEDDTGHHFLTALAVKQVKR